MKIIFINGSPRIEGNTYHGCKIIAERLEASGIETEIYNLANKMISPCKGCNSCFQTKNMKCIINDDLNDLIEKCVQFDGVVLGSPIHYADISGLAKNAFDRLFYVSSANENIFRHMVGASFVSVRRTGGIRGFQTLNNYLLYSEMFIAGSSYWNVIHGLMPKDIYYDIEGVSTLETLGNNLAYLALTIESSLIDKPGKLTKQRTNFVRDDLKNT